MTTHDLHRDTPDWRLPPRCCGTWSRGLSCDICGNWMPTVPANITLADN